MTSWIKLQLTQIIASTVLIKSAPPLLLWNMRRNETTLPIYTNACAYIQCKMCNYLHHDVITVYSRYTVRCECKLSCFIFIQWETSAICTWLLATLFVGLNNTFLFVLHYCRLFGWCHNIYYPFHVTIILFSEEGLSQVQGGHGWQTFCKANVKVSNLHWSRWSPVTGQCHPSPFLFFSCPSYISFIFSPSLSHL